MARRPPTGNTWKGLSSGMFPAAGSGSAIPVSYGGGLHLHTAAHTNWTADVNRDAYTYTYPCGHQITVPGHAMLKAGQVAPPICPTCHGQKAVDQMEAENWRQDYRWNGYAPYQAGAPASMSSGRSLIEPPSNASWLDYELERVTSKAWLH